MLLHLSFGFSLSFSITWCYILFWAFKSNIVWTLPNQKVPQIPSDKIKVKCKAEWLILTVKCSILLDKNLGMVDKKSLSFTVSKIMFYLYQFPFFIALNTLMSTGKLICCVAVALIESNYKKPCNPLLMQRMTTCDSFYWEKELIRVWDEFTKRNECLK